MVLLSQCKDLFISFSLLLGRTPQKCTTHTLGRIPKWWADPTIQAGDTIVCEWELSLVCVLAAFSNFTFSKGEGIFGLFFSIFNMCTMTTGHLGLLSLSEEVRRPVHYPRRRGMFLYFFFCIHESFHFKLHYTFNSTLFFNPTSHLTPVHSCEH